MADRAAPIDWDTVDLVVFDVDGTLYDQRRLRIAMLGTLAMAALRTGDARTLRTIRAYRRVREELGSSSTGPFRDREYGLTAERAGVSPRFVMQVVDEWMHRRPLPLLAGAAVPGGAAVFAALAARGTAIGILSDYPAAAKLDAMGLHADHVVCATDPDIDRLKPDPAGMGRLLDRAGISPRRAVMIGDRIDRDVEVARRSGMRALLRSRRPVKGLATFATYADPLFAPLLAGPRQHRAVPVSATA